MRIAIVTAEIATFSNYRLDMAKEFVERGCDVFVFGNDDKESWTEYFSRLDIRYRSYFVSRNGTNPFKDLRTKKELSALCREEKIDKIWTYQAKPNIYGILAANEAGVAGKYAMMGGLGSVFRAKGAKARVLERIVSAEYRHAFKRVDTVFFQNADDLRLFQERKIITADKVVMTRGSGVNLDVFQQKPMPDRISFLFVGRLVKGKGVFEFLDAAQMVKRELPEAEFHLVGPTDANPTSLKLEQLQPFVDSKVVFYHGEQEDVRPFLERCSCFVLPSYYGEGTPKSGLEALATGRPIIVADAVGSREVVKDGVNGYLTRPRDARDLADKMLLIAEDSVLAEKMAKESRAMAENAFDVRMVNETICKAMGV